MEVIIRVIFFLLDTIRKLLPSLKPMNPKILQHKYYEKHRKKMQRFEKEINDASDKDIVLSKLNPRLLSTAGRYVFRANLAWGRNIEQRYKSAWFNVLAAEAYKLARALESAGGYFHYAAHDFRELGEYEPAGRYYHEAALCFKEAGEISLAIRACKRGIATYRLVEEQTEAEKLKSLLDEWQNVKR